MTNSTGIVPSSVVHKFARKSLKIAISSVVAFLFFVTSLLVNFVQLVNFIAFQYTFPTVGRHINRHLQDIILTQTTTILEWQCGVRFRLFYANKETMDKFGKEHGLVIGNHCFQIDALFYWLCCQMTDTLGSAKAFAKNDLRWMPIIGWAFYFGEFIFLKRNWKEDEKNIGPALDRFMDHPYPFVLLLLPEGTRFTPEKYQASLAYAKEHNIPVKLKYHLLPRVKGFANSLRYLQTHYSDKFGVYHIQLVSRSTDDHEAFEPSLANFIAGKPFKVDCYIEKIDQSKLPPADATEEQEANFVYSVFEHKDSLMEYHRKYLHFPESILKVRQPSLYRVARFVFLNFFVSGSMVLYLVYLAIITHSLALRVTIYGLIISVFAGIFLILTLLQNSNYGGRKGRKTAQSDNTAIEDNSGQQQGEKNNNTKKGANY